MLSYNTTKYGYTLVETLVAISVLLIAIVGPMAVASQGIRSAGFALEQNQAFFLAQEGVEALFALRNDAALEEVYGSADAWDWIDQLNSGPCSSDQLNAAGDSCSFGIDFRMNNGSPTLTTSSCDKDTNTVCTLYFDDTVSNIPGAFTHQAGSTNTGFMRIVTVEYTDSFVANIAVSVYWNSSLYGNAERTVELSTTLFNILL